MNMCCSVVSCNNLPRHNSYCNRHYLQVYRQGKVYQTTRERRPPIIEGNLAKIPLGLNAKDGYAIVDKKYSYLADSNWRKTYYGYAIRSSDKQLLHRVITKAEKGQILDHKNGNKLDNRLENLRFCTQAENSRNQQLKKTNTSGFKGVYKKKAGQFQVKVKVNYKSYYFGCYGTLEEAIRVYDRAAKKLHGDFARLNRGT